MKKFLIALLGFLIAGPLVAQQINDPNAVLVEAKNFHGINISNAFDVYLTQSSEEAVAVSASDEKHKDRIKVEVKDGILYVRYESGFGFNIGKLKLKAYISYKNIDKLVVSGACDVFIVETMKADKLDIKLSGASNLKGNLSTGKLSFDISGASYSKITGNTGTLEIEASGASSFKGYDFVTDYCNAKASGASTIQLTVNKEINAQASGASDVKFKGEAVIRDLKTGGASSVSKLKS
jgi:hypothetical protein